MRNRKLNLRGEVLTELTSNELGAIAGAALSDVCVWYTLVCATVGDCITDRCGYTAICIEA